jgi:anti-anti-sigma factor
MTSIATMTSPSGRVAVLAPRGGLAVDDCPRLRTALRDVGESMRLVVLDLLDVETMDDAVVAVLVGAAARSAARGGAFVVANAQRQPWAVLTQARAGEALRLHRRGTQPLAELLQLLEL